MKNHLEHDSLDDPTFQSLLVACLEKLECGEALDCEAIIGEHPEYADQLHAFLDNQELLRRVASEIRDSSAGKLSGEVDPALERTVDSNAHPRNFAVGEHIRYIGEYEILEEIARGGMGIVFKARQQKLNRIVALKMILSGKLADAADVQRFHREARAAGQLKHPNIVPVHEIGEHEGRHYFTMDFVDGHSLAEAIRDEALPPRRAAEIVRTVAEAVQFAHEQGTVHRDLKPANILLTDDGAPHITDFGLAKIMDAVDEDSRAELTATGQILGTPSYMSPEQASGKHNLVGPATDIYALGAVLYACLTGRAPLIGESTAETILLVMNQEPVAPRLSNPQIPKDLETICLKCLAKEPHKRYGTAKELSDDLDRFMEGRPIYARPVTRVERVWRWCHRNPMLSIVGSLLLMSLLTLAVGGPIVATHQAILKQNEAIAKHNAIDEQKKAERLAEDLADALDSQKALTQEAERQLYYSQINHAVGELEAGRHDVASTVLQSITPSRRAWETNYLLRKASGTPLTLRGHDAGVTSVAFSPDERYIVSGSWDQTATVWDAESGSRVLTLRGHQAQVNCVDFSSDGQRIVSGSADKSLKVWNATNGKNTFSFTEHSHKVTSVDFAPDGRHIVSGAENGEIIVWTETTRENSLTLRGHEGAVSQVAYSPDGTLIVSGSRDGTIRVWNATSGENTLVIRGRQQSIRSVAFSPDGRRIVSGGNSSIKLWNATDGKSLLTIEGGEGLIESIGFSPDGRHIVSGHSDKTIRVWDVAAGENILTLRGHQGNISSVIYSPDGRRIVSGSWDKTIKVWDTSSPGPALRIAGHQSDISSLDFSPSGDRIVTAGRSGAVKLWNTTTGENTLTLDGHGGWWVRSVAYSPDGHRILSASWDKMVKTWDAFTGENTLTLQGHESAINSVAMSPDGGRIISGSYNTIKIWDAVTGVNLVTLPKNQAPVTSVAFSPDGQRIASGGDDKVLNVWDAVTGRNILTLHGHTSPVLSVAFGPYNRRIVSASYNDIKVWDVATGKNTLTLRGHAGYIFSATFSPDGRRIMSGSRDQTVKIWDATTGENVLTIYGHEQGVTCVTVSNDNRHLASGSGYLRSPKSTAGEVIVWDAGLGEDIFRLQGHRAPVVGVAFSRDGRRVVSQDSRGSKIVWNSRTGDRLEDDVPADDLLEQSVSPDGLVRVIIDGEDVLLIHDNPKIDLWLEDVARRNASDPAFHADVAKEAERNEDWFAARFHLRWLVEHSPSDDDSKNRLKVAEAAIFLQRQAKQVLDEAAVLEDELENLNGAWVIQQRIEDEPGDERSAEEELQGHIERESLHLAPLKKDTAELQQQLEDVKADILRIKAALETGDDSVEIDGEPRARAAAREILASRFEHYQTLEIAVTQLSKFYQIRSEQLDRHRLQFKDLAETDQTTTIAALRRWQKKLQQMNAIEEAIINGEEPDPTALKLLRMSLLIDQRPSP